MKALAALLSFLLFMQIMFDIMVVQNIIDGEAAYRIITFHGSTVDADALKKCLPKGCVEFYP